MKRNIIYFLLLLFVQNIFAEYKPMLDTKKRWCMLTEYGQCAPEFKHSNWDYDIFSITNDTIINDQEYQILYSKSVATKFPTQLMPHITGANFGYLREDVASQTVYIRFGWKNYNEFRRKENSDDGWDEIPDEYEQEHIFCKFDVQLNETIRVFVGYWALMDYEDGGIRSCTLPYIVTDISYDEQNRKVITLKNTNSPLLELVWVESIGPVSGGLYAQHLYQISGSKRYYGVICTHQYNETTGALDDLIYQTGLGEEYGCGEYKPILDVKKQWTVLHEFGGVYPPTYEFVHGGWVKQLFTTANDTIIEDQEYKVLKNSLLYEDKEDFGYLREDLESQTTYIRFAYDNPCDNEYFRKPDNWDELKDEYKEEQIYCKFDVQVGDELSAFIGFWALMLEYGETLRSCTAPYKVIDISYDNQNRKIITLQNTNISTHKLVWIESIGPISWEIYSQFLFDLFGATYNYKGVICTHQYNEATDSFDDLIYQTDMGEKYSCGDNLYWDAVQNANIESFELYPNPTKGRVEISLNDINQVQIFNALGQKVYSTTAASFDISHLANGLYIINITTNDGKRYNSKLIKE